MVSQEEFDVSTLPLLERVKRYVTELDALTDGLGPKNQALLRELGFRNPQIGVAPTQKELDGINKRVEQINAQLDLVSDRPTILEAKAQAVLSSERYLPKGLSPSVFETYSAQ